MKMKVRMKRKLLNIKNISLKELLQVWMHIHVLMYQDGMDYKIQKVIYNMPFYHIAAGKHLVKNVDFVMFVKRVWNL
jgi:hypothetical protein